MFNINVIGLINMIQVIFLIFKKWFEGGVGDIINVGSIVGCELYFGGSIYCVIKVVVCSFIDVLCKEFIVICIRVMEIDFGQVEIEFFVVRFYGDKVKVDVVYVGCELLMLDDIVEVVVFVVGRRENVVIVDILIFFSYQVCFFQILCVGV